MRREKSLHIQPRKTEEREKEPKSFDFSEMQAYVRHVDTNIQRGQKKDYLKYPRIDMRVSKDFFIKNGGNSTQETYGALVSFQYDPERSEFIVTFIDGQREGIEQFRDMRPETEACDLAIRDFYRRRNAFLKGVEIGNEDEEEKSSLSSIAALLLEDEDLWKMVEPINVEITGFSRPQESGGGHAERMAYMDYRDDHGWGPSTGKEKSTPIWHVTSRYKDIGTLLKSGWGIPWEVMKDMGIATFEELQERNQNEPRAVFSSVLRSNLKAALFKTSLEHPTNLVARKPELAVLLPLIQDAELTDDQKKEIQSFIQEHLKIDDPYAEQRKEAEAEAGPMIKDLQKLFAKLGSWSDEHHQWKDEVASVMRKYSDRLHDRIDIMRDAQKILKKLEDHFGAIAAAEIRAEKAYQEAVTRYTEFEKKEWKEKIATEIKMLWNIVNVLKNKEAEQFGDIDPATVEILIQRFHDSRSKVDRDGADFEGIMDSLRSIRERVKQSDPHRSALLLRTDESWNEPFAQSLLDALDRGVRYTVQNRGGKLTNQYGGELIPMRQYTAVSAGNDILLEKRSGSGTLQQTHEIRDGQGCIITRDHKCFIVEFDGPVVLRCLRESDGYEDYVSLSFPTKARKKRETETSNSAPETHPTVPRGPALSAEELQKAYNRRRPQPTTRIPAPQPNVSGEGLTLEEYEARLQQEQMTRERREGYTDAIDRRIAQLTQYQSYQQSPAWNKSQRKQHKGALKKIENLLRVTIPSLQSTIEEVTEDHYFKPYSIEQSLEDIDNAIGKIINTFESLYGMAARRAEAIDRVRQICAQEEVEESDLIENGVALLAQKIVDASLAEATSVGGVSKDDIEEWLYDVVAE